MSATVFYSSSSELATLTNTFDVDGTPTDPTSVSLVVTKPDGTTATYTSGFTHTTSTGVYSKDITCDVAGLWQYLWTGTGTATDAFAGSWQVYRTARRYAGLEALKDQLGIADTTRDTRLLSALDAAASSIDNLTGRKAPGFGRDTVASARTWRLDGRVFRDCDGQVLLVDEIADTTGMTVEAGDGTTWSTLTGWTTEPENATAYGRPVTRIRLDGGGFTNSRARVTAIWGWPAVPGEVSEATLLQASRLYKRKDSPEGVMGSAEWGPIRVSRIDPDVQALISHLVPPLVA